MQNMDWALLAKYLNGECNQDESEQIESWIAESENNRKEFDSLRNMMAKTDLALKRNKFSSFEAWPRVMNKALKKEEKPKRNYRFSDLYKYAAILVVAFLLGSAALYFGLKAMQADPIEIASGSTVMTGLVLPDGTQVALNSNSILTYPDEFEGAVREVTISGEAFFDVTPNPGKPFIIHAGEAVVKVVGTSFNVNAYPGNPKVEVIVASGKVEVSQDQSAPSATQEKVLLTPGEKGILTSGKKNRIVKQDNSDRNYLAWKTQSLEFNETPLHEVVDKLQQVYGVEILIQDEELNELVLTARFDQKPVEFILNVIRLTFNLQLTNENNQFILSQNDEPINKEP